MEKKIKEAISLHKGGELQKAENVCLEIINKEPNNFFILYLLGIISLQKNALTSSVDFFNRSIKAKHDNPEVHYNLGVVLYKLERLDSALDSYNNTIKFKPDYAQAYYNSGIILKKLGKVELALENYQKAIKFKANYAEAYYNSGIIYKELKQFDKAIENYQKAIELKPDIKLLHASLVELKNKVCIWSSFDKDINELENKIIKKNYLTQPFHTLSLYNSPELQIKAAKTYIKEKCITKDSLGPIIKTKNKKIILGYFSADFCQHPVSQLAARMFELHDKSKFELIAFSFGRNQKDQMHKRISSSFDQFINVHTKTDREIAELSRKLKIDIAIDMMGFSNLNRIKIFAEKCAPIQINFLGYPGTSGSGFIDYIIADKILITKENQENYSEKIIYLPNSYQPNDPTKKISNKIFTKEEFDLPKESFVFCNFNQSYKINPYVFDAWMKILEKVQNSVLWLLEDNPFTSQNIKNEANKRNIKPDRIIFAKELDLHDHLARHKLADLFIDTFPYTAHTTCSDALWSNLPVLTRMGKTFASRVAGSLLTSIDLKELITNSETEFIDLAVELANNSSKLKKIKQKLQKNIKDKPLYNAKLFTKNIETAYQKTYERYMTDQTVSNIEVI